MKLTLLILFFFISLSLNAQFDVEFNELIGELTKTDKYKPEFGRYDGYQIPLYAGEAVNFIVYSDAFNPKIVFVSPSGNVYKQSEGTSGIASIITSVPEEGEWVLYVVGDLYSLGKYTFQYAFASSNSLNLSSDSDFCTTLNFIIAHAKAYFLLFENLYDSKQTFVKLNKSKDAFIDDSDASYNALFLETNNLKEAENLYKELQTDVSKCLDNNWTISVANWYNVEDYKVKSISYSEKVKENGRFVKLMLLNLKGSKQKFMNDFAVQIVVNRNRN
ncbi:MAG: hypothetical protein AB1432_09250 [Bacteroidota bacterium]